MLNNIKRLCSDIKLKEYKIDWKEYFMSIAWLISSRSSCNRLKVGAVIVRDNRIISVGYNGFLPKAPHISRVRDNHEQGTVHAEQNAITDCAKRGVCVNDATIYIITICLYEISTNCNV